MKQIFHRLNIWKIDYFLHFFLMTNFCQILANLLPSHLYFIILQIVMCHLVSIKIIMVITFSTPHVNQRFAR